MAPTLRPYSHHTRHRRHDVGCRLQAHQAVQVVQPSDLYPREWQGVNQQSASAANAQHRDYDVEGRRRISPGGERGRHHSLEAWICKAEPAQEAPTGAQAWQRATRRLQFLQWARPRTNFFFGNCLPKCIMGVFEFIKNYRHTPNESDFPSTL